MGRWVFIMILLSAFLILSSCSKKSQPVSSAAVKPAETKPVKKAVVKTAVPKVIVVNDSVAKRSVDGRYYYDLEGRRYWRNNRDGKYYLFHKSMFENEDFKAPARQ
jgi:hypothetical protein